MISCTFFTSISFCLVTRDLGYMMTHQRRCLRYLPTQLLVYEKNLSCNWQKYQATLSIGGILLLLTVDVKPQDLTLLIQFSVYQYHHSSISGKQGGTDDYGVWNGFILLISCTMQQGWPAGCFCRKQRSKLGSILYPNYPFICIPYFDFCA